MACGVIFSAAMVRSPSFTRSSSSTTITVCPAHGRNGILDTRKRPSTLNGLFDYVKAPAHMGDVSERVPA